MATRRQKKEIEIVSEKLGEPIVSELVPPTPKVISLEELKAAGENSVELMSEELIEKMINGQMKVMNDVVADSMDVVRNSMTTHSSTYSVSGKEQSSDTVKEIRDPVTVPSNASKVTFSLTVTKNLGNYESLKFSIGADEYCDPSKKNETWNKLRTEVEQQIEGYIETLDRINIMLDENQALSLQLTDLEASRPASPRTKQLLNKELQKASEGKLLDYMKAIEVLKVKQFTEIEMRQLVHLARRKDYSFFVLQDPVEAQKEIDAFEEAF